MTNTRDRWFLHPQHGFMLRRASPNAGYDYVVTALCLNTVDVERSREAWERHKLRLLVNGGSGAVAFDELLAGDRNPAFASVAARSVPTHIRADFLRML